MSGHDTDKPKIAQGGISWIPRALMFGSLAFAAIVVLIGLKNCGGPPPSRAGGPVASVSSQPSGSQSASSQSQTVTVVTASQQSTASAAAIPVDMTPDPSPPADGLTDHVYPPETDKANPEADVNWSTPTRGHLGYHFFQMMPNTPSPFFPSTQWKVECTEMFTSKPVWKLAVDSTTCGDSAAAFRSQSTSDQPVTVKEGFNHI